MKAVLIDLIPCPPLPEGILDQIEASFEREARLDTEPYPDQKPRRLTTQDLMKFV